MLIKNPILTGFHADPCICRKSDDYYIAVSSFEWFPGIPIYHSRDLKHWELYTHVLTDETTCDLTRLPSSKGIWAPCLTYCEEDNLFYVVYGVMNSMNARYFDINNYVITAKDIRGPWSDPVYLHSSGFDASLFHDTDGRKWLVSLDWETRTGYEKPGGICIVEYDPMAESIKGYPKRIWHGGTDRGCLEAPHLTKRGDYYYLMCAEGGTGYYHCITMARALNPMGPYESDPENPVLTAVPDNYDERSDVDHLKPRYYNPDSYLQKCGHGSYIDTPEGETWLVHLCARPFTPELRCTLGRETAIQRMIWTEDGWLRMASGSNLAETYVEGSRLPDWEPSVIPETDDFDSGSLGIQYYAPRIAPSNFCDLHSRPGWLRMRGQESGSSLNKVSILARKLRSVNAEIITKMDFSPEVHQHSAGIILYYDNMNYIYLRKYFSETLNSPAISVVRLNNGEKTDYNSARCAVGKGPIHLKLRIRGRESQFYWSENGAEWMDIGPTFDTSEFSDEYSEYGEFTGCFVGMTCADRVRHMKCADFDYFTYRDLEPDLLEIVSDNREITHADKLQKDLRRKIHYLSSGMRENDAYHNSYEQERREQECIRVGDLDGLRKAHSELDRDKVGKLASNMLRSVKNIGIVVVTLSSRSAIAGGLPAEIAFAMSDTFIQEMENQKSTAEVDDLIWRSELEYCLAVNNLSKSSSRNPVIVRCIDMISQQLSNKITVNELAQSLNISPDYLSQLFSREEGLLLSDYIAREKARVASRELLYSDKSCNEIAASLGFSSQSHFGKVFKKWMGMTPNQYRRLYGKKG